MKYLTKFKKYSKLYGQRILPVFLLNMCIYADVSELAEGARLEIV